MAGFERGTLWQQVTATTQHALQDGSLQPIATEYEFVKDSDCEFLVRILTSLRRKHEDATRQRATRRNPFLPYDPSLYVADATSTHVCLLNKYNVVDHHLLIVTKQFEDQETPLTSVDFEALWRCLAEYDSLGFYNGGTLAGASQPHKHLQTVPLPLAPRGPAIPLELLITASSTDTDAAHLSRLPFLHSVSHFRTSGVLSWKAMAQESLSRYRDMMAAMQLDPESKKTGPYNLLVTRRWMLLVPRRHECYDDVSLNALAFAGALLVRDRQQLELLKTGGPMEALRHVARGN